MRFALQHVHYMPKELEPGVLYVSEEFDVAAHLCPCGCGTKIRTPLDSTEWALEETDEGPTLSPSIGNWQHPCQSHYCIVRGEVAWAEQWTAEQISAGQRREQERRRVYYEGLHTGRILDRAWRRMKNWVAERLTRSHLT